MFQEKKGILGLETVRIVIITLLILAVTAIAVFLALVSLQDSTIFADDSFTGSFSNETIALGDAAVTTAFTSDKANAVLSSVVITNATGGEIVPANNYTVTAGTIANAGSAYNNTNVNVSASITWTQTKQVKNDTDGIIGNITGGTTNFFSNVPTFMTLLGVVVLLLIIAIVLVVVGRFSGSSDGFDRGSGGGSFESGSML